MHYEGNEEKWFTRAVWATGVVLCVVALALQLGVHYGWVE
jgi:hypothetical protein